MTGVNVQISGFEKGFGMGSSPGIEAIIAGVLRLCWEALRPAPFPGRPKEAEL